MKKILFNDKFALTQAVLDGRKTQTRRIINPQPEVSERIGMVWKGGAYGITSPYGSSYFLKDVYHNFLSGTNYPQCRRFKLGEVVAVAQSYKDCGIEFVPIRQSVLAGKKSDIRQWGWTKHMAGYNNKMFTAADILPNRIRITDVRVERLQDISESDCIAEGIYLHTDGYYSFPNSKMGYDTPREAYAALIDKISGKGTFESNPYAFAYTFELVK